MYSTNFLIDKKKLFFEQINEKGSYEKLKLNATFSVTFVLFLAIYRNFGDLQKMTFSRHVSREKDQS